VESNLYLCHDGMIATMDELRLGGVCALVNILQLHTAFLVEPVLNTGDNFVLVHS